jgi:dipeptidyl aminopeptidase/acylaminoacyl peptidase
MTHRLRMRRAALLLSLALLAVAAPELHAQERRPLTALDLYHLRTAGEVALSPDGRQALYVLTRVDSASNAYQRDLWLVPTGGGEPRRLTSSRTPSLGSPAFSPDGRQVAFTTAREGRQQIWILPLADGGEAWPLTSLATGAGGPVWSPDGRRIAFTSSLTPEQLAPAPAERPEVDAGAIRNIHRDREAALAAIRGKLAANAEARDPRVVTRLSYQGETTHEDERWSQIYVVDVREGAVPVRLTGGHFHSRSPAWSPDGRTLAYVAGPPEGDLHADYVQETDVFLVSAEGGEPRRLSDPGFAADNPAFTSDGRHIVHTRRAVDTPHPTAVLNHLVVTRADGGDRRPVTGPMDISVGAFRVTRDGWLYFTAQTEGAVSLFRTRPDRIAPAPVLDGPRGVLSFDVAGSTVAWVQMDPVRPSDLYAAALDGRRERRLTQLNDSLLATVHVSPYEEIWYPSFDGTRVQGWFLRPLGWRAGESYPLAVQIHGGPHAMWGPGEASMWLEYQMLAGAGYTVFFSNPRGSGGYGEAGLQSIHRDWGTSPARDILIGADSVIARGLADPARQVVTGGSYAGYMTAWLIAHEAPERFRAAVAARGVYDLAGWFGGSNTWRLTVGEFGAYPWEDPEIMREQSPLTYVANIRTPLLLLHAETDYRTTIATAESLYRALTVLQREVEFVRYPRAGHELTRSGEPAHRVDHMLRTLEYFERHVR